MKPPVKASLSTGILAGLLLAAVGAANAERVTIIQAGTVLAVPGEPPLERQSIVIRGAKVAEIRPGYVTAGQIEAGEATVVDLTGYFVMPGLIDAHVHLLVELGPEYRLGQLEKTDAETALDGALYARRTLEAGFTTVRDLSSVGRATFAVRDAIADGKIVGPRMLVAGNALWATGHLAAARPAIAALFDHSGDCDGPYDCRRAVREQVGRGADVIKIHATGAVLSDAASWNDQQLADDELSEIVRTAHALRRPVAAHAHGARGVNAALAAGVDSIEHGTGLNDESIRLFKKSGAWLVPTLMAAEALPLMATSAKALSEPQQNKARQIGGDMKATLLAAYKAGVNIALGSDSGVTPHGRNARELVLMAQAGMSRMDVLRAATLGSAELLGIADEIGSIEAGKSADIVALKGNPLDDIAAVTDVAFVMANGTVIKQPRSH